MVFVSLIPLLLRRCVLPITCAGLASTSCLGQALFFTVSATPYDRQMNRVYPVLTSTNGQCPSQILLSVAVNHWMTELHAMPYQYSKYWQTPAEVDFAQAADCKGKAVALYAQMRRNGATNVRVVVGKRQIYNTITHAWLEWETKEGSYVLDPTFNEMPTKTTQLDAMTYIPLYAYDGEHKYRAVNTGFVVSAARVAAGYGNQLYVPATARSTLAQPSLSGVGSGRSSSATTKYATPNAQHRQPNVQRSSSNAYRSSSNVAGLRQSKTVAAPNVKRVITVQPRPAKASSSLSTQRRPTPNVQPASGRDGLRRGERSTSHAVGLRQARSSAQNGKHVTRVQPRRAAVKRLPPQS